MVASAFYHFARTLHAQGKSGQARYYIDEAINIKTGLNNNHPVLKEYLALKRLIDALV